MGSCLLRQPEKRKTIVTAIQQAEPANAELHAWVIMPNHAHVLFRPMRPLPELIKAWKRASAKHIGNGSIWQRNYRDTLIRNQTHYNRVVRYIRKNPIRLAQNDYSLWESEIAKLVT
jgi:REP element-mobilizing transposase RayT